MSVTPPRQGGHAAEPPDADLTANGAAGRWGTVSGGLRSPPPAPSSGAGVRRNHTIHGARHHGKPRLEKHFEQPEVHTGLQDTDSRIRGSDESPSATTGASVDHVPSPSIGSDTHDAISSLSPTQALYSTAGIARNLSLPSRHPPKLAANLPQSATQGRTSLFNSLSAITGGSDLDEHDWEKMIHSSNALGDEHQQDPHASHSLSLQTDHPWSSSLFSQSQLGNAADSSHPTSPVSRSDLFTERHAGPVDLFDPAALTDAPALGGSASFVRRHQSLNHHSGRNRMTARSTDLRSRYAGDIADPALSPYSSRTDAAFSPVRHTTSLSAANSPVMPTGFSKAPWNHPTQDPIGSPSRFTASITGQNLDGSLSEVSKTLSNLDLSGSGSSALRGHHFETQDSLTTTSSHHLINPAVADSNRALGARKLPQLVTNRDVLQRGRHNQSSQLPMGPMSAAAYVPPIGHAHSRHQSNDPSASNTSAFDSDRSQRFGPFTAAPTGSWMDKESIAGRLDDFPQSWTQHPQGSAFASIDPNVMALSMALAQEQQRNAILQAQLGARGNQEANFFGMQPIDLTGPMQSIGQQLRGGPLPSSPPAGGAGNLTSAGQQFPMHPPQTTFRPPMQTQAPPHQPAGQASSSVQDMDNSATQATPVDPISLALQKGYNPAPGTFDLAPPNARYFVIKSYTEDDVHKSLKYEIWASTDKGNQRLDKAFRESARDGPIYLFYSVNASGHFCGMAQMLTPLDYATSSNVWAQDGKWKGTFKVRWIYVKDLPNGQLRHIRLTNTPECKPVTQSRDTQELTPEAGREVLRIMAGWTPKTSLLQDFNFYEMQGRVGGGQTPSQQGVATGMARPVQNSPAVGLGGLGVPPRNSPKPNGSPAFGVSSAGGGLPFPTSPDFGLASRSPNGGARRAPPQGTPQRMHGILGLGLTPGTHNINNGGVRLTDDQNGEKSSHAATGPGKEAHSAAEMAGLAPSAL